MGGAAFQTPQPPSANASPNERGIYWLQRLTQAITHLQQTMRQTNGKKVLADGQLTNAKTTLYTVPAGKKALVRFMSLGNITGGAEAPVIYYKASGGTSREVYSAALAANISVNIMDEGQELCLSAGDVIEGKTTNNTAVDFVISGAEESNNI